MNVKNIIRKITGGYTTFEIFLNTDSCRAFEDENFFQPIYTTLSNTVPLTQYYYYIPALRSTDKEMLWFCDRSPVHG